MAFIFRKRLRLAKGLYLNFSKSGVSTSISPFKGLTWSVGKRGTRSTVSLPGTGMRWTSSENWGGKVERPSAADKKALNDRIKALNDAMLQAAGPEHRAEAEKHLIPLVTQRVNSITAQQLRDYAKQIEWAEREYQKAFDAERQGLPPPALTKPPHAAPRFSGKFMVLAFILIAIAMFFGQLPQKLATVPAGHATAPVVATEMSEPPSPVVPQTSEPAAAERIKVDYDEFYDEPGSDEPAVEQKQYDQKPAKAKGTKARKTTARRA